MMDVLEKYFRCPPFAREVEPFGPLSTNSGFFTFGGSEVCFGKTSAGHLSKRADGLLYDVCADLKEHDMGRLPFDPSEVITNLTHERYWRNGKPRLTKAANDFVRRSYYAFRPILPLEFRSRLQKFYLRDWRKRPFPRWPVDTTVDNLAKRLLALSLELNRTPTVPFIWFWPNGASACAIMTHDVEEEAGRAFCSAVMDTNDEFEIPASFQVVPEKRYEVTRGYLDEITNRGYEVNVQDLNHDGRLFWDLEEFKRRAEKINKYGKQFGAIGFRAAILYRNQEWFKWLDFEYDMSTPNVAHLDPQRGGCCTVMPYFVGDMLELPVTASQDHTVMHILHEYSLDLWKEQMSAIMQHHGLISFIVHPDYIIEDRANGMYRDLLSELSRLRQDRNVWIAPPGEVNRWWRERSAMTLEQRDGRWVIEGPGKERARIASASLQDGEIVYSVSEQ